MHKHTNKILHKQAYTKQKQIFRCFAGGRGGGFDN